MEKITKFLQDIVEGFASLHVLARQVKIGPKWMTTFKKHAAYNTSAFMLLALLLVLSINFLSPAEPIGLATGVLSTLLSLVLVGVVGFIVNLAAPANEIFGSSEQLDDETQGTTNKWASYLALNFASLLLIFFLVNLLFSVATGRIAIPYLSYGRGYPYDYAAAGVVLFCSVVSSGLVFWLCRKAGKIVDSLNVTLWIFTVTNLFCAGLFYFLHFYVFVQD